SGKTNAQPISVIQIVRIINLNHRNGKTNAQPISVIQIDDPNNLNHRNGLGIGLPTGNFL
ncbi:hypothetical protein PSZ74_24220, partial [Shigella sonnei]|nr:hypothetical protein [Shigella sonnei]